MRSRASVFVTLSALALLLAARAAAPVRPDVLNGLVWRNVGPFRGGRISAASGVVGEAGTFYAGTPAGGVWKTTSAGEVWYPVFDAVKDVSSIGALDVAPSNGNIIYVGTGDGTTGGGGTNEGNGMYKSTDGGATWTHLAHPALDKSKQIPSIVVSPVDANRVLVAALGDVRTKNDSRGAYLSTDGGRSWTRTLFIDDETGVEKLAYAFDRPDVIYAASMRRFAAPVTTPATVPQPGAGGGGGRGGPAQGPTGTTLYKSTDGGLTWKELTGGNLPRIAGRTSIAVAQGTNAQRVYWTTNNGLFRSDDGGATWRQMDAQDTRIRNGQGGYNCGVLVDPKNPDLVYVFNTASYISRDGGNTFTGFKGAPGGDDPQQGWIDPTNGSRIFLGYDQGAIISLDGGKTWSSWYNQSIEQVYHINVDNQYPYWIYASQQDAGAIRTRNRGNLGAITTMDWNPVNSWEWGTVIPDPNNPNIVYGSGSGIVKISYPTEQWINVSPAVNPDLRLRSGQSAPLIFAPWNSHELIAGFQLVMTTIDGGQHWTKISPDLGYPGGFKVPADTAAPVPGNPVPGNIESMGASPVGRGTIWVGTTNGLVKVTKDEGKTWDDATIAALPIPMRASILSVEPSHTVAGGAYVTASLQGAGDNNPYAFRTKDYGKTWTKITNGLPGAEAIGAFARVLREDPKKPGLLFLGTESNVYVSFDDGDNWQSLQLNLPLTSMRDIKITGNDLIVGTYGRGLWILDDYAVLRQVTPAIANEDVHLFKPDNAVRIRRNIGWNTPFPPEVPHAQNPPEGAIIYYWFGSRPSGDVTLDVLDSAGNVIRHQSNAPITPAPEAARPPHPNFWVAVEEPLPTNVGTNRATWDLKYDAPPAFSHSFEINANPGQTPASPEGPLAPPGTYTVRLKANGKTLSEKLTITNDPRSPASTADVKAQGALLAKVYAGMKASWDGYQQADAMRSSLRASMGPDSSSQAARDARAWVARLDSIAGGGGGGRGGRGGRGNAPPTFQQVHGRLQGQLGLHDNGDLAPTAAMLDAWTETCRDLAKVSAAWASLSASMTKAGVRGAKASSVSAPRCSP